MLQTLSRRFWGQEWWRHCGPVCLHLSGALSITEVRVPSAQTVGVEGPVDGTLEEQQEVGVVGRGAGDLQVQQTYEKLGHEFQLRRTPLGAEVSDDLR